jgi:hypothetical protein
MLSHVANYPRFAGDASENFVKLLSFPRLKQVASDAGSAVKLLAATRAHGDACRRPALAQ